MGTKAIPILMCGKIPSHVQTVTEQIQPEFEVLQNCPSADDIRAAVNDYFGNAPPAGGKPQVIVMGGGFSQAEYESAISSLPAVRPRNGSDSSSGETECQVTWLRPAHFAPGAAQEPPISGPPPAEVVAGRVKKELMKHVEMWSEGKGKGETFYY